MVFLILPIAHEDQIVRRLPWVTIGIIVLNVTIFFFSWLGTASESEILEKQNAFVEYVYTHPYLTIPEDLKELFTEKDLEDLELLKESVDMTAFDEETVATEQAELNALAENLRNTILSNPAYEYGYVNKEPSLVTLFTHMFFHGGWLHLIGNMLFLYLAGCNIEDVWGRPLYAGFYLLCGIGASLTDQMFFPDRAAPSIGASGAIAGLMGAFLVRFYKTKIRFLYFRWLFFVPPRLTFFHAPAWLMLPLWFLTQVFYLMLVKDEAGIAFAAHVGGFLFGFGIALGMNFFDIEGKYLTPELEKKVSLSQNPLFVEAMALSERKDYPRALILLERVIRQEPNHLEAYMEMQRIAEEMKDGAAYTRYSAGILDAVLRTRDWDLLLDLYDQFQKSPLRQQIPAKTLFHLASFYEEQKDFPVALRHYQEVAQKFPDDLVAMRAWSKMARMLIERMELREKGIEAFQKAYDHPLVDEQFRAALQQDARRLQISIPSAGPATAPPSRSAPASAGRSTGSFSEVELPSLPFAAFDRQGDGVWTIVPVLLQKLTLKGLILSNDQESRALLPWRKIKILSVGRIQLLDAVSARMEKDYLSIDLLVPARGLWTIYRISSNQLDFSRIFPRVEQTFSEAYQNLIGIILSNSGASCWPDRERCVGPSFKNYPDLTGYESEMQVVIQESGSGSGGL